MRLWILVVAAVRLAAAGPAKASPVCGGNACYPVLTGPIKTIAIDFCSYYLKYPRSTTTTVKTTATATAVCTIPPSTVKVTATALTTVTATSVIAQTVPGAVISETVTATVTANLKKRNPTPGWSAPKGAGANYKPPALSTFAPAIISAACSCLVPPSTTTIISTSTISTTVPNPCTQTLITATVQTVTNTVTVTTTNFPTVTLPPTTSTVTITTTVAAPVPTCQYPLNDQRGVRGIIKPGSPGPYYFESGVDSAATCYSNAKNLQMPWSNANANLQSYTFASNTNPGSPDGPGDCKGYSERSCENLLPDPAGNVYGGDTSLAY